jgi:lipid kinase YegS
VDPDAVGHRSTNGAVIPIQGKRRLAAALQSQMPHSPEEITLAEDRRARSRRLIVHGGSACDPLLREAIEALRERGHDVSVRVTWEGGDAARCAQEAASEGIDVVAAGGGDGTVNEVVRGVMEAGEGSGGALRSALAVVPLGTANDFAVGCGVPVGDIAAALKIAATHPATPIDVGRVNDRYFINAASAGFGAEVTANTPKEVKRTLGGAAYTIMGLVTALRMAPYPARITAPGLDLAGEIVFLTVANGPQTGGGFRVAPQAQLDDGRLDLLVVRDFELLRTGELISEIQQLETGDQEYVHYHQVESLTFEVDRPIPMNLDGEPFTDQSFRFSILPKRLPVILPPAALERAE